MPVVEVEDGAGSGRTVRVTDGGAARTEPAPCQTTSAQVTVTTTSAAIAQSRPGRRQIMIQNASTTVAINIALEDPPATATHFVIQPGSMFEFPPGVTYEGAIEAVSASTNTDVIVIEYHAAVSP